MYSQNKSRFNGVCYRDNLPDKVKDGAYVINLDEYYPKENLIANIFRLQAYDSVMCGYFYIGFIDFMLKENNLTDFINLFSPNDFKKK